MVASGMGRVSGAGARPLVGWEASRRLTLAVAAASGVVGLALFLAPARAAPRFAWSVSPLVVMSIGGWFLGNAVWASRIARDLSWSRQASGPVYLWCFGVLQTAVLLAYRERLVLGSVVAAGYLTTIALLDLAALVGVAELVKRPQPTVPDRPMPPWLRALAVAFVAFVGFLFTVALVRPTAAVGGRVFPEDLTPFTTRAFGVYFLALVLGAVVVVVRGSLAVALEHLAGGLTITALTLVAAFAHLEAFDFAQQPLQWIYVGAYVAVIAVGAPVLGAYRRAERRAGPARRRP